MAAKAKAKSKTAEKKKEYHLKDYLSMCKVNAVILDFKGLRYFVAQENGSFHIVVSPSVITPEEMEEAMEKVPGIFRRYGWMILIQMIRKPSITFGQ